MLKLYYKIFLLTKHCKFIKINRGIIVSRSLVHNGSYYFWYIDSKNKFKLLNIGCSYSKQEALFRYKVLMGR